jgi:hypothetical protein
MKCMFSSVYYAYTLMLLTRAKSNVLTDLVVRVRAIVPGVRGFKPGRGDGFEGR